MLKKIVAIKNVGKFKNSVAQGNPQLAKHTLIVGANGYGKTTICAILRSLQTGDAAYIIGRKTLGVTAPASVELLFDAGAVRFDGTSWGVAHPNLAIYDGTFITENVHSGEVVEIDHKRNLYRVIIGQEGVHLAEEDSRLAKESRAKTGEITAAAAVLQAHVPVGMNLEGFLALPADPDIDTKIIKQKRALDAVRQASEIQARPALSEIILPILPDGFSALLAKTIDNITEGAEQQLAAQLAAHHMMADGESWIAQGMAYINDDKCPFCGRQGIQGLSLISAYQAVFSTAYKALKADVASMRNQIAQQFGDRTIGVLNTLAERNRGNIDFWGHYCAFDSLPLSVPESLPDAIRTVGQAAIALLNRKALATLEPVPLDHAFNMAINACAVAQREAMATNAAIQGVNALITAKKVETGAADVKGAEGELNRLIAIKKRHEQSVAHACTAYIGLEAAKNAIDIQKEDGRARLEEHTNRVVRPYERRINHFLDAFNAGFRIAETKHSYPGGIATSSYRLVINQIPIDVGDGHTPPDQPSFKNTLSSGDRTTLALSFFLAHLERDAEKAQKLVIFDDPFNSQDAFRRRQTVHEIMKVARACAQVIVLSHDATFLKHIWEKAPAAERVSLQIYDAHAQGAKISIVDLDKACQGRIASELDDLQSYLATGAGNPIDLIKKMRVVSETHCHTTYPTCFCANDYLGDMLRKIREGGEDHLVQPLYDELDQINEYTKQYHHGEGTAEPTTYQIDPVELTGFVRRTLKIANALQA